MGFKYSICGLCERYTTITKYGFCRGCVKGGVKHVGLGECIECGNCVVLWAKERCSTCYNRLKYHKNPEAYSKKKRRLYFKHHEKNLERGRNYHFLNPKTLEKSRHDYKLKKQNYLDFMKDYKKKCVRCGYDRCFQALEFHHIDPEEKNFLVSFNTWFRFSKKKIKELFIKEMKKCVLLCSNCHRELEYKLWKLEELEVKLR